MLYNILSGQITTAAKTLSDKVQGVRGNGLLLAVRVTGTGHAEADFLAHSINLTLRHKLGENIPLMSSVRFLDILKISDFLGGFSADLEGDDGTVYSAYINLGSIVLQEDDSLEMTYSAPGDASAVYDVRASFVETQQAPENLIGYELITGNGAAQLIKDVYSLFFVTDPSGATIQVIGPDGQENLLDYDVVDLANAVGRMESYEEIGVLYSDKRDMSSDINVKLPASTYAVAVRGFFQLARAQQRIASVNIDNSAFVDQLRAKRPEKFEVLRLLGRV